MLERFLGRNDPRPRAYTLMELCELWRAAAAYDPAIGLRLFATYTPQDWHPLAYVTQLCAHVDEAIDCFARYGQLTSNIVRASRVEDRGLVGVELDLDAPEDLRRHFAEHFSVVGITQIRRGTGSAILPTRVDFKFARPPYHSLYQQWFGDNVRFGSERGRILFAPEVLRMPMRAANAAVMDVICSELDRRLSLRRRLDGCAGNVAAKVRGTLLRNALAPSVEEVARALGQSSRTLSRWLADEGITYRGIVDQVRLEVEQLLELQGLTRGEIAVQLGFGGTAAYLRARKRWHT